MVFSSLENSVIACYLCQLITGLIFFQRFKQSMRAIQGALIVASLVQIIIGFFGFWRIFAR